MSLNRLNEARRVVGKDLVHEPTHYFAKLTITTAPHVEQSNKRCFRTNQMACSVARGGGGGGGGWEGLPVRGLFVLKIKRCLLRRN